MNAAKGAALSLLNEAYKSRDKICLITFQGDRAQVRLSVMSLVGWSIGSLYTHIVSMYACMYMNLNTHGPQITTAPPY